MRATQFIPIVKRFCELTNHGHKLFNFSDEYLNNHDYGDDVNGFINGLTDKCQRIDMALLRNSIAHEHFPKLIKAVEVPLMVFVRQNGQLQALTIFKDEEGNHNGYLYDHQGTETLLDVLPTYNEYVTDKQGQIVYLTPFPMPAMVSEPAGEAAPSPMKRLLRLLNLERKDIWYVYFYAFVVAIISLSLPLGIQAIMELVSGGVIFSSIVLIVAFVILGVAAAGGLQILQYQIVEVIQRRIFVKAAFEFTHRLPRIRTEAVFNHYTPELMNRFFDVLTIQKSLPKLLIDLAASVLQIVFGIVLLSFYHPYFIFFGILVIGLLAAIFYFTGPDGLRTSIIESKYKYKVVHWLEDMARALEAFKMAGHTNLPLHKTENLVNNYLYYRKKHFKVLMMQFANIVGFKTIVTGGLLIMGIMLVINRQILIGQFVASEVVIILIMAAVEKVILTLSTVYDTLTAVDKIGHVTDLPLERKGGLAMPRTPQTGVHLRINNLSYMYKGADGPALQGVNLEVQPGERLCIAGFNSSGKNTLVKIIAGILEDYRGSVAVNNLALPDINLNHLRDIIAANFAMEDLFDGSILENITMGKTTTSYEDALWALDKVGLLQWAHAQKEGLQTELVADGKNLSASIHLKLTLARCIAERPQLLIINDFWGSVLQKDEKLRLLAFLIDKQNPWTLLLISNDPVVMSACDSVAIMGNGRIMAHGSYEEVCKHDSYKELIIGK